MKISSAALLAFCFSLLPIRAEVVHLVNGDRLNGRVLSMDSEKVIMESEIQGRIELPRLKVAAIHLVSAPAQAEEAARQTSGPVPRSGGPGVTPATPAPDQVPSLDAVLKQLQNDPGGQDLINEVQGNIIGGASPEAARIYQETVRGLMSGEIGLADIRAQAQDAAGQLRDLKGELGEEAEGVLEGYLSILDSFLRETEQP